MIGGLSEGEGKEGVEVLPRIGKEIGEGEDRIREGEILAKEEGEGDLLEDVEEGQETEIRVVLRIPAILRRILLILRVIRVARGHGVEVGVGEMEGGREGIEWEAVRVERGIREVARGIGIGTINSEKGEARRRKCRWI